MPFKIGDNVGSYQITEQLGRGGMATVFKAYHPALERNVAIKGMHRVFTLDENFRARFQREARVVAKLEHPNIVPIYDFSEHEGQPYLVMKFIEGETLKAHLRRVQPTKEEIVRIARDVGLGLAYAHKQGILHRDIKPSNVLIDLEGRIYLTDFGLARIAQAGESTMSADVMLGTPQYISPEQAQGIRDLDAGTDIYSYGVMLYEMTVGEVPFSADTPFSIVHDHIYTPLPLPRQRNPGISEALEHVLLKALAKKREDRYETVEDLVEAFEGAMLGDGNLPPEYVAPPEKETVAVSQPPASQPDQAPTLVDEPAPPPQPDLEPVVLADSGSTPKTRSLPLQKKRKRSRWWLAVPVVLVLGVCGFIGLFTLNALREASESAVDDTEQIVEDAVNGRTDGDTPGETDEDARPPAQDEPPPPPVDDPIESAARNVEAHPDDPYAHLELAVVLWDEGMYEEAAGEFNLAIDIGIRSDEVGPRFFRDAANVLYERELWVEAVDLYVMVTDITGNGVPRELVPSVEHAIFNAVIEDHVLEAGFLERDDLERTLRNIDSRLIVVARARHNLYFDGPQIARRLFENIMENDPEYPPGLFLQAEFYYFDDDLASAVATLEHIIDLPHTPPWLRGEVEYFLMEIQEE